eukprot:m.193321 g.193321  ORF g.193321 m.193321 type:complete len:417 (+) comp25771_c0_seq3:115-1365(+)
MPSSFKKLKKKLLLDRVVQAQTSQHPPQWRCCKDIFTSLPDIYRHITDHHITDLDQQASDLILSNEKSAKRSRQRRTPSREHDIRITPDFPLEPSSQRLSRVTQFLQVLPCLNPPQPPSLLNVNQQPNQNSITTPKTPKPTNYLVLLFYKYYNVKDPSAFVTWQTKLCEKLQLTGKIRVAFEGINGTVSGTFDDCCQYIACMLGHPWCLDVFDLRDFKVSTAEAQAFQSLRVTLREEITAIGIPPSNLPSSLGGRHATPSEFHNLLQHKVYKPDSTACSDDVLLLDCRNYYEAKIGRFEGAVCPDIRKFSYFPDYVKQNTELFKDKTVMMYCTGGIRCERGSAVIKALGVANDVIQLQGGIHKVWKRCCSVRGSACLCFLIWAFAKSRTERGKKEKQPPSENGGRNTCLVMMTTEK